MKLKYQQDVTFMAHPVYGQTLIRFGQFFTNIFISALDKFYLGLHKYLLTFLYCI